MLRDIVWALVACAAAFGVSVIVTMALQPEPLGFFGVFLVLQLLYAIYQAIERRWRRVALTGIISVAIVVFLVMNLNIA